MSDETNTKIPLDATREEAMKLRCQGNLIGRLAELFGFNDPEYKKYREINQEVNRLKAEMEVLSKDPGKERLQELQDRIEAVQKKLEE